MSRLSITSRDRSELVLDDIYKAVLRRVSSGLSLLCPVDMAAAVLRLCHAQSCGKCTPCRVGLGQLADLVEEVLHGDSSMEKLELIERTAKSISDSADCAIGFEAANIVLRGLEGFRDDYICHIETGHCSIACQQGIPCQSHCPAGVEIPDYIACVAEGRYADAIRIIRKDNPFPSVCGYVCEHPCENRCRRSFIDDAVNIRAVKRFAADNAGDVEPPKCAEATGKKVAVIGGGPGGLTAAYYLALMGHSVDVFEKRKSLGGMLRYGIPRYRLPAENLDWDINAILKTGVNVKMGVEIGKDYSIEDLQNNYDATFVSIGAHTDKKLRIPGVEGEGVIPAVKMLGDLGEGIIPDFSGKTVSVIGGGNVAMDAARSAIRCGAKVNLVYRRRKEDMTALPIEVEGAMAEGCELLTMMSPDSVERDASGKVTALIARPQRAAQLDRGGRPTPVDSGAENVRIQSDIIIIAIGQAIESEKFGAFGIPLKRDTMVATETTEIEGLEGFFAGGDCVSGPATVIRAIAGGKVAAANIDNYLGYNHIIEPEVETPAPHIVDVTPWGRANNTEREANERRNDFEGIECPLDCGAATREAERCLRCDHHGYGPYWENRRRKW